MLLGLAFALIPLLLDDAPRAPLIEFLNRPRTLVCLGDSVTGVYYHTGGLRAYPEMLEVGLRQLFPHATLRVVNAGISGHTTKLGLDRLDRDVLAHQPDLVTVAFGLNDLTSIPLETFRANLTAIVDRCRGTGAQVVLCTPNAVIDTAARPIERLEEYCRIIREVCAERRVVLCDQYAAAMRLRTEDAWSWRMTMSDEIHPNMEGHKRMAEELAWVIAGRRPQLLGLPSPRQPLRVLRQKIQDRMPLRCIAMPPYHGYLRAAIRDALPEAGELPMEFIEWPITGQSLPEIERYAQETVRKLKPDLVIVAVPVDTYLVDGRPLEDEPFVRSYSWVMNWALSFGALEWDCLVVHPAVARGAAAAPHPRDELVRRLVRAQDLSLVDRAPDDLSGTEDLFRSWLQSKLNESLKSP
ncbi:MAG: SGNH/GDSL hydrolase family protein [Planctomycetes bacterium]|nr:SGNH/GDSL hydrolase family protein [Planctomycetota bacterium]